MPSPRTAVFVAAISAVVAACGTALFFSKAGQETARIQLDQKPTVIPPLSAQDLADSKLQEACVRNSAFRSIASSDRFEGLRQSFDVRAVRAEPFSDRGVICQISGRLVTERVGGSITREEISRVLLVSLTGEAEFASMEFIKQLISSKAVTAMASNVGNDGTVVPAAQPQ